MKIKTIRSLHWTSGFGPIAMAFGSTASGLRSRPLIIQGGF